MPIPYRRIDTDTMPCSYIQTMPLYVHSVLIYWHRCQTRPCHKRNPSRTRILYNIAGCCFSRVSRLTVDRYAEMLPRVYALRTGSRGYCTIRLAACRTQRRMQHALVCTPAPSPSLSILHFRLRASCIITTTTHCQLEEG